MKHTYKILLYLSILFSIILGAIALINFNQHKQIKIAHRTSFLINNHKGYLIFMKASIAFPSTISSGNETVNSLTEYNPNKLLID